MRHDSLCSGCAGSHGRHLQEAAPALHRVSSFDEVVEPAFPLSQVLSPSLSAFQWNHLNSFVVLCGYLNGSRVCGFNDSVFFLTSGLVRVLRNSTTSLTWSSLSFSGRIPPSRLGLISPPLL